MRSLRSRDEQLIDSGAWKMQLAGQGVNGCLEVSHPPLPPGVVFPAPCRLCSSYSSAACFVSLVLKAACLPTPVHLAQSEASSVPFLFSELEVSLPFLIKKKNPAVVSRVKKKVQRLGVQKSYCGKNCTCGNLRNFLFPLPLPPSPSPPPVLPPPLFLPPSHTSFLVLTTPLVSHLLHMMQRSFTITSPK